MIGYSIIIPTRNRAQLLNDTLKSILQLQNKENDFEVIIIDNASSDNTFEIINQYENIIPNLRYVYQEKIGLHEGRNMGLKIAKGEILCYLDDDVYLFKSWMNGIKASFKDINTVLVGGKILPRFETNPPDRILEIWNTKKNIGYLSILDLGDKEQEIDPFLVYGCNFSIRKKILLEARGFHPDGFPQELIKYRGDGESYVSQYIKNNGYRAYYNPKASVFHFVPQERITKSYFRRRAFNQGVSDSYSLVRRLEGNRSKVLKSLVLNLLRVSKSYILMKNKYDTQHHLRGNIFHLVNCLIDKRFMEYVLRDNYLDNSDIIVTKKMD